MPIRAAWVRKRLAFRVGPGRCRTSRFRCNTWLALPYPVELPGSAGVTHLAAVPQRAHRGHECSSLSDPHRARACQGTASRLILVRSAYTCSAIYQQFFVP